ncbi:MAG: hypothetical protein HZB44_04600 [Actinobacteria bacterium]|nr:hypothetical protein [Actinomycetota bacterium]
MAKARWNKKAEEKKSILTEEEWSALEDSFLGFDFDGDGKAPEEANRIFNKLGFLKEGKYIGPQEFLTGSKEARRKKIDELKGKN